MFTWFRGYPLLHNAIPAFVLAKENLRVLELVRVVFGRFLKNLNNFTIQYCTVPVPYRSA